jgi:hypothetical protein
MAKKLQLTPKQYADIRGISLQSVTEAIRFRSEGKKSFMPGVLKIDKFGRFYLLTVSVDDSGNIVSK